MPNICDASIDNGRAFDVEDRVMIYYLSAANPFAHNAYQFLKQNSPT